MDLIYEETLLVELSAGSVGLSAHFWLSFLLETLQFLAELKTNLVLIYEEALLVELFVGCYRLYNQRNCTIIISDPKQSL